jgi:predicted nucleic acid-binding Zn ribbon protein
MKKEKHRCATCGKVTRKPVGACSECAAIEAADKKRGKRMSRLYFWLFITLGIMGAFLLWSARGDPFVNENRTLNSTHIAAIIAIAFAIMFGLFCFVRFLRNRSIAGGLFLTVAISTAVVMGTSQLVESVIPPTAAAFSGNADAVGNSYAAITGLAQVGLFTLWFLLLLLTIYTQVSPVKKIDKALTKIIDGEGVKHIRIGKSRQYRCIAEKLELLSNEARARNEKEELHRERLVRQRERAKERKTKLLEVQKHQEERLD